LLGDQALKKFRYDRKVRDRPIGGRLRGRQAWLLEDRRNVSNFEISRKLAAGKRQVKEMHKKWNENVRDAPQDANRKWICS
jgi:hypothetical protein